MQADLLNALGVFGEGLIGAEQFGRLVGKERLMSSSLMEYLYKDKLEEVGREHAAERARIEHEREERERLRQAVVDAVSARFPQAPITVVLPLQQVHDTGRLYKLLRTVLRVPDQVGTEAAIREAALE